jgi:hypothetical protein
MNKTSYNVELTFTQPLLGSVALNPEIYKDFIASKAPNPQEAIDTELPDLDAEAELRKGSTGFLKDATGPYLHNHVIKGFLKASFSALRRDSQSPLKKVKAHISIIDGTVFAFGDSTDKSKLYLELPKGEELVWNERPIRCQTMQGPRVALIRSEQAPAGTKLRFTITVLGDAFTEEMLSECLSYGEFNGIGQFRNGYYGPFTWSFVKPGKKK